MRVVHVVGARPNFMKIAPLMREMSREPEIFQQCLVHTGQHYDSNMSKIFFQDLDLPQPDANLGVGSGSHSQQTAQVMLKFEAFLKEYRPQVVIVVGDVNSTVACALVAAKSSLPVAHVEAGLRSFDRRMPEEINRVVTDHLSDWLFTTEPSANENLEREGISTDKIHFVGNVMIDTLVHLLPRARERWQKLRPQWSDLSGESDRFALVTLHRPSNVDDGSRLGSILESLKQLAKAIPVIFPLHPRTRERIEALVPALELEGIELTAPLGYLDFLALEQASSLVITDSGGIQEETTFLGVPCLTLRSNTERPVTLLQGSNRLVESNGSLVEAASEALNSRREVTRPNLWDGQAAARIVKVLATFQ